MIAIFDYGSGNIRSAQRAFEKTGRAVVVTSDYRTCVEAAGLVLPGVGAFASCVAGIKAVRGDEIIEERIKKSRPTLGICVGMQVLFTEGSENRISENFAGLGFWRGTVSQLNAEILPHMGWNTVTVGDSSRLFNGVEDERFYFVHSYAATDSIEGSVNTFTSYNEPFLAAVEGDLLSGTQFHPEKSGAAGLKFIENWVGTL